jgi:hypothetical protein
MASGKMLSSAKFGIFTQVFDFSQHIKFFAYSFSSSVSFLPCRAFNRLDENRDAHTFIFFLVDYFLLTFKNHYRPISDRDSNQPTT